MHKCRLLLSALFIITLTDILSLNSYAQDEGKERGWKGYLCKKTQKKPSCKAELLAELKKVRKDEDKYVEGYVMDGSDIIGLINEKINEEYISIKINNSVIEGGLDFDKLPEGKREVPNKIVIINSLIKSLFLVESSLVSSVNANKIHFRDEIIFSYCTFSQHVYFFSAEFDKEVSFVGDFFLRNADFSGSLFREIAYFGVVELSLLISGIFIYDITTFSMAANFSDVIFGDDVIFFCVFNAKADFSNTVFMKHAVFGGGPSSTFNGEAKFSDAEFIEEANFSYTTFEKSASFSGAKFFSEFLLTNVLFKEFLDLRNIIIRKLNYKNDSSTVIGARIDLRGAWITEAHFENMVFEKDVDFSDMEFGSSFVLFNQNDILDWNGFRKRLKEDETSLEDNPSKLLLDYPLNIYDKAEITDLERYIEPNIIIRMKLLEILNSGVVGMYFYNERYFKGFDKKNQKIKTLLEKRKNNELSDSEIAILNRLLLEAAYPDYITNKLGEAEIDSIATVFRFVTFKSDVSFISTKFYGSTAFEDVNFRGEANFTYAEFKRAWDDRKPKLSLSYLNFKNFILRFDELPKLENWVRDSNNRIKSFVDFEEEKEKRSKLKDLQPLWQVFEGLEENFRGENMLNDRNQAHYYGKTLEPKNSAWLEVESIIWGTTTHYGTDLKALALTYGVAFIFFTFVLFRRGQVIELQTGDHKVELRLLTLPTRYFAPNPYEQYNRYFGEEKRGKLRRFVFNLWYSIRLALELLCKIKIWNKDTAVAGNNWDIAIVSIGWFVGFLLLVAFTTTLANTSPFVSKLIRGVF